MLGTSKRWLLIGCLLSLVVVGITGCSSLTRLYFQPRTLWLHTPEAYAVKYEDVWLEASDGVKLHAWWLMPEEIKTDSPVILYLHGNAQNISTHARSIYWLVEEGYRVLALDYRGFGASEGAAVMPDVLLDLEAAARWLVNESPNDNIAVLGQSMGSALAINFVAEHQDDYPIEALVLDSTFSGFPSIARNALGHAWIGWLFMPFTWLVPSRWDPEDKVKDIRVATLVLHSPMDSVLPYEGGRTVYSNLPKSNCWLDSLGPHIASFRYGSLRVAVADFIDTKACPVRADEKPSKK